eukprot:3865846-Pleurochrysis_carterae.AAC.1
MAACASLRASRQQNTRHTQCSVLDNAERASAVNGAACGARASAGSTVEAVSSSGGTGGATRLS